MQLKIYNNLKIVLEVKEGKKILTLRFRYVFKLLIVNWVNPNKLGRTLTSLIFFTQLQEYLHDLVIMYIYTMHDLHPRSLKMYGNKNREITQNNSNYTYND